MDAPLTSRGGESTSRRGRGPRLQGEEVGGREDEGLDEQCRAPPDQMGEEGEELPGVDTSTCAWITYRWRELSDRLLVQRTLAIYHKVLIKGTSPPTCLGLVTLTSYNMR